MHKGCPPPDSGNDMNRLRHFRQVGTFLQTGLGISIDAIGALDGVRNRQCNQRLFSFGQFPFGKNGRIIFKKLFG